MSIRVGNKVIVGGAAIASVDEPGVMRPDGQTIDINEDIISVLAIKDQNKQDISNIKFWTGTLQEYNNLGQWDDNTLYNILDDTPTSQEGIPLASQHNYGIVKVDGDTINITQEGVISANIIKSYNDLTDKPTIPSTYTLPTASTSTLGGVKVDGETITIENGVISAGAGSGSGDWEFLLGNPGYMKNSNGFKIFCVNLTPTFTTSQSYSDWSYTFPQPFKSVLGCWDSINAANSYSYVKSFSTTGVVFSGLNVSGISTKRSILVVGY